jgi:hypothetical protein
MKANDFLHKKDVAYMNRLSTSLDFDRIVSLMEEYAALRIHEERCRRSEQLKPLDADMQQALNELTESKVGNEPTKKRF